MKRVSIIIFVFFSISSSSQNFKFGKISEDELLEKYNPRDSSANATVLYKNEVVYFNYNQDKGFQQTREVHERIKIYNKNGFEWATKKIQLYNESNLKSEDLHSLKGSTFNIIDGKIVEVELKDEGQFLEEANKYWKISSFTMPNVKDGCVIEYKYKITSPNLHIRDIDFQYEIPINQYDLSINTPEYFIYDRHINPKSVYYPTLEEPKRPNSIRFTNKPSYTYNGINSTARTEYSYDKFDYQDNVISSSESYIPALVAEPHVDNIDNYRSKLVLEIMATKFPNMALKYFTSSWDDVSRTINDDVDFGDQLNKSAYYKDAIDKLISNETEELKKAILIFNFVKSRIKWNGFIGFTSELGVRKAFEDGNGNVADINLMLTSMLRYAGIEANPVLVSTRSNGIPLFPTIQGFNYVICLLQTDKYNALLDATELYSDFNVIPDRAINWQGRLVRKDGSSNWINLNSSIEAAKITYLNAEIDTDHTLQGKVRNLFSNHYALDFRSNYNNLNQDQYIMILEKDKGNIQIENLEIKEEHNLSKPVNIQYSFTGSDGIEEIGDKIFLSPMLFLNEMENEFLQDKRQYPIDFIYPFSQKYIVNIKLPEGYELEFMPGAVHYQFLNSKGDYSYQIQLSGSTLQIISEYKINNPTIMPNEYQLFKEFYNLARTKQSDKIVLKKT